MVLWKWLHDGVPWRWDNGAITWWARESMAPPWEVSTGQGYIQGRWNLGLLCIVGALAAMPPLVVGHDGGQKSGIAREGRGDKLSYELRSPKHQWNPGMDKGRLFTPVESLGVQDGHGSAETGSDGTIVPTGSLQRPMRLSDASEEYRVHPRRLQTDDNQNENSENTQNSTSNTSDEQDTMFLAIFVVAACGIVTLVVLCSVRKLMDLCSFRNDPDGHIGYSRSEGLPKTSIERLPQEKYKAGPKSRFGKRAATETAMTNGHACVTEASLDNRKLGKDCRKGIKNVGSGSGDDVGTRPTSECLAGDSTADMCAICLVEYEPGDVLRVIPGCKHRFHKECIDPWLATKAVCAYCKAAVLVKRSATERLWRSVSNTVGLNLVAPTTIHFSSTRRTYTNDEVRAAMRADVSARSDVEYVGSMLSNPSDDQMEQGIVAGRVGGIVVQPASAPPFTVVPHGPRTEEVMINEGENGINGAEGLRRAEAVFGTGESGRIEMRTADNRGPVAVAVGNNQQFLVGGGWGNGEGNGGGVYAGDRDGSRIYGLGNDNIGSGNINTERGRGGSTSDGEVLHGNLSRVVNPFGGGVTDGGARAARGEGDGSGSRWHGMNSWEGRNETEENSGEKISI